MNMPSSSSQDVRMKDMSSNNGPCCSDTPTMQPALTKKRTLEDMATTTTTTTTTLLTGCGCESGVVKNGDISKKARVDQGVNNNNNNNKEPLLVVSTPTQPPNANVSSKVEDIDTTTPVLQPPARDVLLLPTTPTMTTTTTTTEAAATTAPVTPTTIAKTTTTATSTTLGMVRRPSNSSTSSSNSNSNGNKGVVAPHLILRQTTGNGMRHLMTAAKNQGGDVSAPSFVPTSNGGGATTNSNGGRTWERSNSKQNLLPTLDVVVEHQEDTNDGEKDLKGVASDADAAAAVPAAAIKEETKNRSWSKSMVLGLVKICLVAATAGGAYFVYQEQQQQQQSALSLLVATEQEKCQETLLHLEQQLQTVHEMEVSEWERKFNGIEKASQYWADKAILSEREKKAIQAECEQEKLNVRIEMEDDCFEQVNLLRQKYQQAQ